MMRTNLFKPVLGAIAFVALSSVAQACPLPMSVNDFFYRGTAADDCTDVIPGNDSASSVDGLFGQDWDLLVKFDGASDSAVGATFVGAPVAVPGGSITFSLIFLGLVSGFYEYELVVDDSPDTVLPAFMDLMGVVKQGSGHVGYLFDDVFVGDSGNLGKFKSTFGPGSNDFSHFTFYGANYVACTSTEPECDEGGGGGGSTPEPATGLLMALGLGLLAGVRRLGARVQRR